jgi:hypothetical protein
VTRRRSDHLGRRAGRCRKPSDELFPPGFWWWVRYHVALRAACYLTIRIRQPHLRVRVVEHIAVCWWRSCLAGGHPGGFDGVFRDYCADVEHDRDPQARDVDWDLHRVWTNHAVLIGGERDEVCWRPS